MAKIMVDAVGLVYLVLVLDLYTENRRVLCSSPEQIRCPLPASSLLSHISSMP